ncbi:GPR55 protein, partial [Notiomystis cincta]|nr:GPR55 protein [Notiomystis cincta]
MTNNSGNCSFADINNLAWTMQLGISIPIFILGIILNSLVLCVFCCFWRKQTRTSVYLISLALADELLLLSLPLKLHFSVTQVSGPLCSLIQSAYFVNTYTSIFIIVCISVDRYIGIRHPFEGRANDQSPTCAVVICCFIWAAAWICCIPAYAFQEKDLMRCFHDMSEEMWSIPFIVFVEIIGFLIPFAVMVFCSVQTICILLHNKSPAQKAKERRSLRIIVINLVVFLVCFTPVHIGTFLQCLVRHHRIVDCSLKRSISLFLQVSMTLGNLNCCLDVFFYYFAAKEFGKKAHLRRVLEVCPVFRHCAV